MKNYSLLRDKIQKESSQKTIILFLDYDGTLTSIVARPEDAILPDENKQLLTQLVSSPQYQIIIITGRSLADIKERVKIPGLYFIGNHGW